jgi:hypothetical protein
VRRRPLRRCLRLTSAPFFPGGAPSRDPVDTKRYLAVLKELFDAEQMPEDGEGMLVGEADQMSHAELGVSATVVDNRLSRMRVRFQAKLVALGMLALLLLLAGVLLVPLAEVVLRRPRTAPTEAVGGATRDGGGLPPHDVRTGRPSIGSHLFFRNRLVPVR